MKNAVFSLIFSILLSSIAFAQQGIVVDEVEGYSGGWMRFDRVQLRKQVIRQLSNNRANTGWRVYDREQVRDRAMLDRLPHLNIYFRYEEARSRSDQEIGLRIPTGAGRSRGSFRLPRSVSTRSESSNRGHAGVIIVNCEIFSPQGEVLFAPEAISLSAEQYRAYRSSSVSTQYFSMRNSSRVDGDQVARLAIQTKVVQDASNQLMNSMRGWWSEYVSGCYSDPIPIPRGGFNQQVAPRYDSSEPVPWPTYGGPPKVGTASIQLSPNQLEQAKKAHLMQVVRAGQPILRVWLDYSSGRVRLEGDTIYFQSTQSLLTTDQVEFLVR